jgi:alkyl hydroperoxide reductase subunit AhpC
MSNTLKVGSMAPDFKAQSYTAGQFKDVSLRDFQGKWVCLFFYPLDFTFVCPTEIKSFAEHESEFKELGCQVLACSTDSVHSHKAWFERDL